MKESPRMVTAADCWECDMQDSPTTSAFPSGKRHIKVEATMAKPLPFLGERLEKGEHGTSLRIRPKISSGKYPVFHHREKTGGPQPFLAQPQPSSSSSRTATGTPIIGIEDDVWPNTFDDLQDATTMMKGRNQQRSEAIAIVKGNTRRDGSPLADDTFQTCSSMERQFDLATWRMYARITEHRRRFPVRPYSRQSVAPTSYGTDTRDPSKTEDYRTNDESRPQASNHAERFLDGEIFDLEM